MGIKISVNGLCKEEINNSYKILCDGNSVATAYSVEYQGEKIYEKAKRNKHFVGNMFIFEAIPIVSAIRRIPKFYNGSKDPVVVATDNRQLVEYMDWFFDWEAKKNERIEEIQSRFGIPCLKEINSMLEPVREIAESYPLYFGRIRNGSRKRENRAHELCTKKMDAALKQFLKQRSNLKALRKYGYL